jgi:hypothetical protein
VGVAKMTEKDPLIPKGRESLLMASVSKGAGKMNLDELGLKTGWSGHYNPIYFAQPLKTITYTAGTVFMDPCIWRIVGYLLVLAFTIATLCLLLVPNAENLEAGSFDTLLKYLKVFLAFMLGMFMNNSLGRWWTTVNALTDYFNNVEKLLFCMNSFGVPVERRQEMLYYCVASCHCLNTEVTTAFYKEDDDIKEMWNDLFSMFVRNGWLDQDRITMLAQIRAPERAGACMSFISGTLAVMFEKEGLKPPAMNRLVLQCQIAVDMVAQLKVQICIQMPFMYAHMMACLVHLNNILVSISCGFSLGAHIGKLMHLIGNGKVAETLGSVQGLLLVLVTLFVEPMLYQAFLQIGTNFCYPFGKEYHHVPLTLMIRDLETNCRQMNEISDSRIRPERGGSARAEPLPKAAAVPPIVKKDSAGSVDKDDDDDGD